MAATTGIGFGEMSRSAAHADEKQQCESDVGRGHPDERVQHAKDGRADDAAQLTGAARERRATHHVLFGYHLHLERRVSRSLQPGGHARDEDHGKDAGQAEACRIERQGRQAQGWPPP